MNHRFLFLCLLYNSSLVAQEKANHFTWQQGAIVRGSAAKKEIALVFTADEYGEGLPVITEVLKKEKVKSSFFFTGRFYRNKDYRKELQLLKKNGHYLGPHSDNHLLYCDWAKRDSLLVAKDSFQADIQRNLAAMITAGVPVQTPRYFIPPFEWWNDSVAAWSKAEGLTLINFTPGIRTNVDYTWPELANYKSSDWIISWLQEFIRLTPEKLNGAILLLHAGTDTRRKDKLYYRLGDIVRILKKEGYQLLRIDKILRH